MQVLPTDRYYGNIIPLNVIYQRGEEWGNDRLDIVYKDLDTGEKKIHTIKRPMIDVYIVKPENRTFSYHKNFINIKNCYVFPCHYESRYSEIARELGLKNSEEARISPYVYGADCRIENYYMKHFILQHPTEAKKWFSLGFFDIENDTINTGNHFPEVGEAPINIVTYLDIDSMTCHTIIDPSSHIQMVAEDNPKYDWLKNLEKQHDTQVEYFLKNTRKFVEELHADFDDYYGVFTYNIYIVNNEEELIRTFWQLIHASDNDFIEAWNDPWDVRNLFERCMHLGFSADDVVPDPRFGKGVHVFFSEDTNPVVHRRRHICQSYTIPTFIDQMVLYAGIRSGYGRIPSHKLGYTAEKELGDTKLDYSETADIKTLCYVDFWKFVKYNIKDVLLLYGLERKTKDIDTLYSRMYASMILPHQAFTTTAVVWNALTAFVFKQGWIEGLNKNKFPGAKSGSPKDYQAKISDFEDIPNPESDFTEVFLDDISDEDSESDEDKNEKYDGAYVSNTLHMMPTGYYIMGEPSKWVHRNVGDEDITSEYPSAILFSNISNDTLVGKVFLEHPEDFDIEIYKSFIFRGEDAAKYKMDVSNFMMEAYSERDILSFAKIFLNLPSPDEILQDLDEENLLKLAKGD